MTTKLHHKIINTKDASDAIAQQTEAELTAFQFQADFTILVGNWKYCQHVATLICGSGAVAGSGMVGTFTTVKGSGLYWLSLLKQSNVKWLAHTYKLIWTAASTLLLKMKRNYCLFCSSVAGTEYRQLCWFIQPTTKQFACLALSNDIAKHCYLTAAHTELHLGDECPPLGYLLSPHRGGRPMKITPVIT